MADRVGSTERCQCWIRDATRSPGSRRDPATHDDHGRELVWVLRPEIPRTVAASRQPGEIETAAIAVELGSGLIERCDGRSTSCALPARRAICLCLRNDHDHRKPLLVLPDRAGYSSLGLPQPIVAILTAAVQSKDHGPRRRPIEGGGHVHLVSECHSVNADRSIQESRLNGLRHRQRSDT